MKFAAVVLTLFLPLFAFAQTPLFDEPLVPLEVTLTADFGLINTPNQTGAEIGRNDLGQGMIDPKYLRSEGTLTYKDGNGRSATLQVKIEPRGMRRRQYCEYKPLEIRLKEKHGLFQNLDRSIDVLTHCRDHQYDSANHQEYFAYRLLNAFNVPNTRIRRANITYVDTSGKYPRVTYVGAFLEPKEDMMKRFGGEQLKLTDDEKAVPLSPSELGITEWAKSRYGDFYQIRLAYRVRTYNKYLALQGKVKPAIDDVMRMTLYRYLVSNYDTSPDMGVNAYPVKFKNGAVDIVEYDFDASSFSSGIDSGFLSEVFETYVSQNGLTLETYKSTKTAAEIQADKAAAIAAVREMMDTYNASGLRHELDTFNEISFNIEPVLRVSDSTLNVLNTILNDPDAAFSFLN